jgi:ANTAR domain
VQGKINGSRLKSTHYVESRAVVLQAVGMVSVQLGMPVAAALDWLQAYAARHERPTAEVAADVVARRLRFSPDDL